MKRKTHLIAILPVLLTLLLLPSAWTRGDECSHQWTLVSTVAATCTESGYELYRCSLCGAEKQEPLAALGHVWSYCVTVKKATCTEDGLTRCYCSRDQSHYEDKVDPARGHAWGEWRVTKQATLSEWGVSERQCNRCGEVEKSLKRPLAYREPYDLVLILSDLPPEVRFQEDSSLVLTQEISLVNTGETDLVIREYGLRPGMTKELNQPLQLPRGQAATFPLVCSFTAQELSLLAASDAGARVLPLTLCFYGSLGSAAQVCASNQVPWEPTLPADPTDVSSSPLHVTQSVLSACADPDGYQLSETLRGLIHVTNEGDDLLPEVRLQTDAQAEPLLLKSLAPGETRDLLWSHTITLEEAVAGYALVTWQASWAQASEDALRSGVSNAVVVPVTSKLDLLLDVTSVAMPNNGTHYELDEEVCLQFRLRNNGSLMLSNVTVFDPFYPDDPGHALCQLDQIRPEESLELTLSHTITHEDVQDSAVHLAITAQGYDKRGASHTWVSGQITLPTIPPVDVP